MSLPCAMVFISVLTTLIPCPGETATEYYVRPSDVPHTSCNLEPCLTLSEYINDIDYFFQSNTTFLFMPGQHYMNETLNIEMVSNILLLGLEEQPQVLANISCKHKSTCIAIRIYKATNVTIKRLSFNLQMRRSVSGVDRINTFSISFISLLKFESCDVNVVIIHSVGKSERGYAISMYSCSHVQVSFVRISYYEHDGINFANSRQISLICCSLKSGKTAITMSNTNNTNIMNVTTNSSVGLDMDDAVDINLTNVTVEQAYKNAMQMHKIENVTVTNANIRTVVDGSGILVNKSLNVIISRSSLQYFGKHGISVTKSINTNIHQTGVVSVEGDGISVTESSNTTIQFIRVAISKGNGIVLVNVDGSNLSSITVTNSVMAVFLSHTNNTALKNISVSGLASEGITCKTSRNVSIAYTRITNCSQEALYIENSSQFSISFMYILYSSEDAITLRFTNDIHIMNTTVVRGNSYQEMRYQNGIHLFVARKTIIANVVIAKANRGIIIRRSYHLLINNVTVTSFGFWKSRYIIIHCVKLMLSGNNERQELSFFSGTADILIKNSQFINNNSTIISTDVTRQPAVLEMYRSSRVVFEDTRFIGNNVSCLKLIDSDFEVNGTLQFIENRAYIGAAMLFLQNSFFTVLDKSSILFLNNEAISTGGAIHVVANEYYIPTSDGLKALSKCILSNTSTGRFIFINNTAGQGGDALYGGALGRACTAYNSISDYKSNITCNSCLRELLELSHIEPATLSSITSDPSRVCFCSDGTPDCFRIFHTIPTAIHSGQTVMISAAVVGQNLGTVAGIVFAHFIHNASVDQSEQSQDYRQQNCNTFSYTVLSNTNSEQKVVLVLTAINKKLTELPSLQSIKEEIDQYQKYLEGDIFPQALLDFSIYIHITILPCPPGFYSTDDNPRCDCNEQLKRLPGITCNIQSSTVSRQGLVWVGYVTDTNTAITHIATSGHCPRNYCKVESTNISMTDPDTQCNLNHSGILCGGCQAGLSLALGSNQCLKCSNLHLILLVPFALAGITLVFLIKVLDITISQGFINGFIFYANIVKANEYLLVRESQINPLTLFISWLSLDLGIETCFVKDMSALTKTWLQMVFPFYVWSLAGFVILLARYSSKFARVFGNNSVPVLVTLFLMSYAKLLLVIVTALSHTVIEYDSKHMSVWSADGNIEYLQYPHIVLFLAAVGILVFLYLPYTLLTLSAQWFLKFNIPFATSALNYMKPILDAHYGPLKDKHRYWFGVLLVTRVTLLLISTIVPSLQFGIVTFSVITICFLLTAWSSIGLYRKNVISLNESSLFINLGLLATARFFNDETQGNQTRAAYFLVGGALTQFVLLLVYRVYCMVKPMSKRCFSEYCKLHTCSDEDIDDEGDWRYNNSIELRQIISSPDISPSGDITSTYSEFRDDIGTQKN